MNRGVTQTFQAGKLAVKATAWQVAALSDRPGAVAVVGELSQVNAIHRLRATQGIIRLGMTESRLRPLIG